MHSESEIQEWTEMTLLSAAHLEDFGFAFESVGSYSEALEKSFELDWMESLQRRLCSEARNLGLKICEVTE